MTGWSFVKRAAIDAAWVLGPVALAAAWLAGPRAALGVVAGGGLAIANLAWLGRRAVAVAETSVATWSLAAGARLAATAAVLAVVLVSGHAHPLGIVTGLTVLPLVLIVRGLAVARAGEPAIR